MSDGIEFSVGSDHVALLRVNRPAARNALTWAAQETFAAAVTAAGRDESIRALIITGVGDTFVSGGDLKELAAHADVASGERLNRVMSRALNYLTELPFPVLAAINGSAVGGGCEILTACDLRLAAAEARLAFRQVQNGLTTGWGGAGRLAALIGQSRAMELLLTGRVIDATEAREWGLVHRVAPADGDVLGLAFEWARELVDLPRQALAALKTLVYATRYFAPDEVGRLESKLFVQLWPSTDHIEAMEAFIAKRPPVFNRDLPPEQTV